MDPGEVSDEFFSVLPSNCLTDFSSANCPTKSIFASFGDEVINISAFDNLSKHDFTAAFDNGTTNVSIFLQSSHNSRFVSNPIMVKKTILAKVKNQEGISNIKINMTSNVEDQAGRSVSSQKVACGDPEQLRKTCDFIYGEVKQFSLNSMPDEISHRFSSRFQEVFNRTIQDNVEISGVPLEMCFNQSYNTMKEKEKIMLINETYLPEVGNLLVKVSNQRKSNPQKISRIVQKRLKNELQCLKNYDLACDSVNEPFPNDKNENNEHWSLIQDQFKSFAKELNDSNKNLQTEIDKVKKANDDVQFAEEVYNRETKRSFGIFSNNCESETSNNC